MRNPFEELKESKAKWITLLVYAVICLITGIIGGWGALSIVFLIPGVCVLIFWLWPLLPEFGSVITATIILCAGAGIFIQVDESKYQDAKRSMALCDKYLESPVCLHRARAQQDMEKFCKSCDPNVLGKFIEERPNSKRRPEIESKYRELCSAFYDEASSKNSIAAWEEYQKKVPKSEWADSQERIEDLKEKARIEAERAWKKESTAWQMAKAMGTSAGYEKYLNLFPKGAHAKAAIDNLVDDVMSGSHGELPSMERTGYSSGSSSSVEVSNDTQYTLTLLYSGSSDSKRLVLSPHQTKTISLRNGRYRIAASVNAANVSSYAGSENLNGGTYSVSYYISTSYSRRF